MEGLRNTTTPLAAFFPSGSGFGGCIHTWILGVVNTNFSYDLTERGATDLPCREHL